MPRRTLWQFFALLLTGTLFLAACGDSDDTATGGSDTPAGGSGDKKRVALAFVGPLTGDNAALGINTRNGIKVAIEEANEKSEKYEYVLKEYDTQGDPAQAPTQADKYVPDEEVIGIVGPEFSGETKAVLPTLEDAELVMVSASATNTALPTVVPNSQVFHRIIPDDDVQGAGLTDYISKKLAAKNAAYVHDNSEYGKGLAEGTQKLLEGAGVKTALVETIDPESQDYSAAVNKVKAANADFVFYGGYYAEAGRLKKQLTDAGVKARFVSGDGALDKGFLEASGAAGGEGAIITCPCKLATTDAPGELGDFAKKYKELNKVDPGTYSSEGYDATNILVQGIEAGNDTREKLLEYMEEDFTSFDGISKTIEFEENGNVKSGDVFVYEIKGGKLTELGSTVELLKS
ncbi:MAG: branched-chain amino acid ABC transporter substrate-binding protein [Actinomycetota bacterium]|nr:branched-chain amino acid ABC transporter substrate-binding protein [Actinomycetota bacterium]